MPYRTPHPPPSEPKPRQLSWAERKARAFGRWLVNDNWQPVLVVGITVSALFAILIVVIIGENDREEWRHKRCNAEAGGTECARWVSECAKHSDWDDCLYRGMKLFP